MMLGSGWLSLHPALNGRLCGTRAAAVQVVMVAVATLCCSRDEATGDDLLLQL